MSSRKTKVHPMLALAAVAAMPVAAIASPVSAQTVMTKGQFLTMFLQSVNVKSDPSGKSGFKDVSAKATVWGYVHRALELGLAAPDSKTRFGVSDTVSAAFAANVAAKYYHMDLNGQQPATWAVGQGLLASSSEYLTPASGKQFVLKLKQLASSIASVPGSWTLTNAERQELTSALANYDNADYSQTSCTETDHLQIQVAPAWQSDASLMAQLKSFEDQYEQYTSTYDVGMVNGQSAAVAQTTLVQGTQGSDALQQQGSWAYVDYNSDVYSSDGSNGWSKQSNFGWMSPVSAGIPVFTTDMLQDVKFKHVNGGDVFTGQLMDNVAKHYYDAFIQGFLSSALNQTKVSQSIVKQMEAHLESTVTLQVSENNGSPVLTAEDVHTVLQVPQDVVDSLGGTTHSAKVLNTHELCSCSQ